MANLSISGLTAGAAVSATDLLPNVQAVGVGPVKTTAAQLKTFMSASPTLVTPTLGVAAGTSLALGGATIGSHALAVTGTGLLTGSLALAVGSVTIPASGIAALSGADVSIYNSGVRTGAFNGGSLYLLDNASQILFGAAFDLLLRRAAAATLQLGAADAAAPVAQTLSVQSVVTGTANTAGAKLVIKGSIGTGTGAWGGLEIQGASAGGAGSTPNTAVARLTLDVDAANTLALRNAANQNYMRVYSSWTDASNGQWTEITSNSSGFSQIYSSKNGTGLSGGFIVAGSNIAAAPIYLRPSLAAAAGWQISASGSILAESDNSYDIGASGATRPRNVYVAGIGTFGGSLIIGATSTFSFNGRTAINSGVDGDLVISNNAGSSFGLLKFGSASSSYPALKRSSTALHVRLADDSAYAPLSAELVTVAAGTATPAGGSTAARLLFGTTAGFGIYYGSGAPTVTAAQGSLYMRSDGSSTSTRLYINTDGGTTWTNVTSAT